MRVCPVCASQCFDDMDICYGCMHRFAPPRPAVVVEAEAVEAAPCAHEVPAEPSNPEEFSVEGEPAPPPEPCGVRSPDHVPAVAGPPAHGTRGVGKEDPAVRMAVPGSGFELLISVRPL